MPNTQAPPEVGTFSTYYSDVATHEWYARQTPDTQRRLNEAVLVSAGWGNCRCGRGGKLYWDTRIGDDQNLSIHPRCERCVRSIICESLNVDLTWFYDNEAWTGTRIHGVIFPSDYFPQPSGERILCACCNGYIFEDIDINTRDSQVGSVEAINEDTDQRIITHVVDCSFKCMCGAIVSTAHSRHVKVDGEYACKTCLDELYDSDTVDKCGWCNHFFTNVHYSEARDMVLCDYCYDSSWDCDECGYEMYEGDSHECYRPRDTIIFDYSYKPKPVFFGSADYYFGFELEVEDNNEWGCEDGAQIVVDELGERVYIKRDGSLNDGFEIVSHPHTFEQIKSLNWDFMKRLRAKGFRSWDTTTCGLHVHISRTAFRKNGKRDEAHELRFQKLIYDNGIHVRSIAGRSSSYARFNDKGALVPKVKFGHTADRYEAVNSQNDHTLEVRVFRGSLNPNRVLSAIEFLHAGVEYTRNMKINPKDKQLSWIRFMAYVLDNKDKYENFAQIALATLDNTRGYEGEDNE